MDFFRFDQLDKIVKVHTLQLSQPWWGEETCLNDHRIYLLTITDVPVGRSLPASQPWAGS